jgi:hypothetical protein
MGTTSHVHRRNNEPFVTMMPSTTAGTIAINFGWTGPNAIATALRRERRDR